MNVIPHPIEIDRRVDAVVLQKRHRDPGNRRGFHVWKAALQHAQARDAHDGLDLPGLNERHHNRAALRDEHRVAEPLGFILQILDAALSALLAQKAELIERRGALALQTQALRHEKKATLERHRCELLAPQFVIDEHADVIAIDRGAADPLDETVRVFCEFLHRHGRRGAILRDVIADGLQNRSALLDRLRNVFLRLTKARRRDRLW